MNAIGQWFGTDHFSGARNEPGALQLFLMEKADALILMGDWRALVKSANHQNENAGAN